MQSQVGPTAAAELPVRIGVFGIGLDTYWPQFPGLKERLDGYRREIAARIEGFGAQVFDVGLIDSPEKAMHAGERLNAENVELVFLHVSTYALSSTVLPIIQRCKSPVVVLNLQPTSRIDYESFNRIGDRGTMTGEWLAHCQAVCAPEIASVFKRSGTPFRIVTGHLQEEATWDEVQAWVDAARVHAIMNNNRLGILGHYYDGMLDVYTDVTRQVATFGGVVKLLEMCELREIRDTVTDAQIDAKVREFQEVFEVSADCEAGEITRAARTSVALDALVARHRLGSMAYYYEGVSGNEYEDIVTSVIAGNSLLTGRGVPISGECEVKNAQAMKITDAFGAGGSFSEFYGMDFDDDVLLLGHDGPAHFSIAEGPVGLVPLPVYHGKPGKGLSIQMSVKHGPATLLSVCEGPEGVSFLTAEAESVPGPVLNIGNTNSRYRFSIGARELVNRWAEAGPSHHCSIGVGHIAGKIEKLGSLLGIRTERVC